MLLCLDRRDGGIFQVRAGGRNVFDAASLISRLIFHVFAAMLKNTR